METQLREVAALQRNPRNVRVHDERNVRAIMDSFQQFGQTKPIVVDRHGVIRAGHGRLQAAIRLGWSHVLVVESELEGDDAEAYALADNRTAEHSEWDTDMLASKLDALRDAGYDLDRLGFTASEREFIAPWAPPEIVDGDIEVPTTDMQNFSGLALTFDAEVWPTIHAAIERWRAHNNDPKLAAAVAIVGVCEQWLEGDA